MSTLSGGPNTVTDGLILYLDAANPSSYVNGITVWNDLTRNNNNGILINGPTFNSGNGGSIVFDGVDDYTLISNSQSLQVGETFTITCWIRPTGLTTREAVFSTRGTNQSGCWQLEVGTANNNINTVAITGVNTWIFVAVNNTISLNNWFNISFVRLNNSVVGDMYINGILVNSQQTTSYNIINNNDPVYIACTRPSLAFFKGNISTLSFYNRALSVTEILQNYNTTKTRFGLT